MVANLSQMGWVCVVVLLILFESAGGEPLLIDLKSDPGLTASTSWPSSSIRFAFGFQSHGSGGYLLGVWLLGREAGATPTLVWTPFRDDPPVSSDAKLVASNGCLLLRTEHNDDKNITAGDQLKSPASYASMQDSGNFVLYDQDKKVIWESFKFPTDTILGGQNLSTGSQLFSNLSETDSSTGQFHLSMQGDGNLILYNAYDQDTAYNSYWGSNTWNPHNPSYQLYLDNITGQLLIRDSVALFPVDTALFEGINNATVGKHDAAAIIYRATLGWDGVLRLYAHQPAGKNEVEILWSAPRPDQVKGLCGLNSYPEWNGSQTHCYCLPGTDFVNHTNPSLGCGKEFAVETCAENEVLDATQYQIISLRNQLAVQDRPYAKDPMLSEENCSNSCLQDCYCDGALFVDGYCMKHALPLKYISTVNISEGSSSSAFFKVVGGQLESKNINNGNRLVVVRILVDAGLLAYSATVLALSGFLILKSRVVKHKRDLVLENDKWGMAPEDLTLRCFSYKELRRATKGFRDTLGKGSFGAVYMGALHNGRKPVAVKRLEKMAEDGEREFQAEVRAIGKTHHKNLVRLLGYCTEGSNRLLVYEFMSNHSLADLLFRPGTGIGRQVRPHWDHRVGIALDVARGIRYLHDECGSPIIHCDIKPQNILMDDSWIAKISDFGLSKLLMPDQTRTFTGVRGTRGYLAPEWHKNIPISVKADIYSYGIVLLELVCCRRNLEVNAVEMDAIVLSTWAYKCFAAGELFKLVDGEEVERRSLDKMVKVGLWCIQDEPALRPSMKTVVLMLQGIVEISIPPCPTSPPI